MEDLTVDGIYGVVKGKYLPFFLVFSKTLSWINMYILLNLSKFPCFSVDIIDIVLKMCQLSILCVVYMVYGN